MEAGDYGNMKYEMKHRAVPAQSLRALVGNIRDYRSREILIALGIVSVDVDGEDPGVRTDLECGWGI